MDEASNPDNKKSEIETQTMQSFGARMQSDMREIQDKPELANSRCVNFLNRKRLCVYTYLMFLFVMLQVIMLVLSDVNLSSILTMVRSFSNAMHNSSMQKSESYDVSPGLQKLYDNASVVNSSSLIQRP